MAERMRAFGIKALEQKAEKFNKNIANAGRFDDFDGASEIRSSGKFKGTYGYASADKFNGAGKRGGKNKFNNAGSKSKFNNASGESGAQSARNSAASSSAASANGAGRAKRKIFGFIKNYEFSKHILLMILLAFAFSVAFRMWWVFWASGFPNYFFGTAS